MPVLQSGIKTNAERTKKPSKRRKYATEQERAESIRVQNNASARRYRVRKKERETKLREMVQKNERNICRLERSLDILEAQLQGFHKEDRATNNRND